MITITLTLPESAAAALWDDVTWGGKNPRDIADIAQTLLTGRAAIAETHLPAVAMPAVIAKFKAAHQMEQPPQPTQSKPDCDCGSGQASWHGEAPDLRQYCCDECYHRRTS